jgi:tetratricopeptide (TPR) repeat protein
MRKGIASRWCQIFFACAGTIAALVHTLAFAQAPPKPENLQVLPKDISRDALIQRMREFSFALSVRCQYCHVGGDGISFEGVVFKSDEKIAKQKARVMLRMVDTLNSTSLKDLPGRSDPPVRVDCVTCHRGLPVPKTLETVLAETIAKQGIPAAVQRYRELREREALTGRYNFGEWTINELARSLAVEGKPEAALAMLEMNGEYYPKSGAIDFQIAELHRMRGEKDKAIARYRRALEKEPTNPTAKRRLEELLGNAPPPRERQ